MSYLTTRKANCSWIEYTQSSAQTISSGTDITWNTKKTTGGDGVSIDSSTGIITLNSDRSYWIQGFITFDIPSEGDFKVEFQDSNGNSLSESDGNFPAYFHSEPDRTSSGSPFANNSQLCSLLVKQPSLQYKLVATTVPANTTVHLSTHLFITESR